MSHGNNQAPIPFVPTDRKRYWSLRFVVTLALVATSPLLLLPVATRGKSISADTGQALDAIAELYTTKVQAFIQTANTTVAQASIFRNDIDSYVKGLRKPPGNLTSIEGETFKRVWSNTTNSLNFEMSLIEKSLEVMDMQCLTKTTPEHSSYRKMQSAKLSIDFRKAYAPDKIFIVTPKELPWNLGVNGELPTILDGTAYHKALTRYHLEMQELTNIYRKYDDPIDANWKANASHDRLILMLAFAISMTIAFGGIAHHIMTVRRHNHGIST